jgi:catechol 2,3-dioxygenase-like lactoylglutathione lyase family enzyme
MKRLHIHVRVETLDESIRFYRLLFGAEPLKTKPDYAKWLLNDPRMNFAISTRAKTKGLDHLGIHVDDEAELTDLRERLKADDMPVIDEGETRLLLCGVGQILDSRPGRYSMGSLPNDGGRPTILKPSRSDQQCLLHARNDEYARLL